VLVILDIYFHPLFDKEMMNIEREKQLFLQYKRMNLHSLFFLDYTTPKYDTVSR